MINILRKKYDSYLHKEDNPQITNSHSRVFFSSYKSAWMWGLLTLLHNLTLSSQNAKVECEKLEIYILNVKVFLHSWLACDGFNKLQYFCAMTTGSPHLPQELYLLCQGVKVTELQAGTHPGHQHITGHTHTFAHTLKLTEALCISGGNLPFI